MLPEGHLNISSVSHSQSMNQSMTICLQSVVFSQYIQSFINSSWTYHYGDVPEEKTVTFIWSTVVALYALGGLLGSITVRYLASHLGRLISPILICFPCSSFECFHNKNGCSFTVLQKRSHAVEQWHSSCGHSNYVH